MKTTGTKNAGQFSSWHMERTAENKYSASDSSKKPAPGERSKFLVTDGRPAGTHFRENAWAAGGARHYDLARFNGTAFEPQSDKDAPGMKGDRARTADGTLREVRADQGVANNPTLQQKAPELVEKYGDKTVGELRAMFGGLSVSQIAGLSQSARAKILSNVEKNGSAAQSGGLTAQLATIMQQS
jgi:hypothetical protein